MIQNTSVGRTSTGARVTCDAAAGFVHWAAPSVAWRLSTANQGSKPGVAAAVQNAMAAWNGVSPAGYALSYAGTGSGGFTTNGVNTVEWAIGNGCTGGCLAMTALVLVAGQVITEADVSFNDAATWNTNGGDYDVEAVAAHEFGHTLGIHHTELNKRRDRPTMYATYFGTDGRTLAPDDVAALNCAWTRYPPAGANLIARSATPATNDAGPRALTLTTRPRPDGVMLRFTLDRPQRVRLDVFDVAGRRLATLVDGERGTGEHEVAWDGGSSLGNIGSGIYFARAITPMGKVNATMFLVR